MPLAIRLFVRLERSGRLYPGGHCVSFRPNRRKVLRLMLGSDRTRVSSSRAVKRDRSRPGPARPSGRAVIAPRSRSGFELNVTFYTSSRRRFRFRMAPQRAINVEDFARNTSASGTVLNVLSGGRLVWCRFECVFLNPNIFLQSVSVLRKVTELGAIAVYSYR